MTTDNPDPLEVWKEACQRSQNAWYEIGEQPNDPECDAQNRLADQAAAAIIAQHYAPVIAENERLRGELQWAIDTLQEINPSNYDHDDVCNLNGASVEVILGLQQALGAKP